MVDYYTFFSNRGSIQQQLIKSIIHWRQRGGLCVLKLFATLRKHFEGVSIINATEYDLDINVLHTNFKFPGKM